VIFKSAFFLVRLAFVRFRPCSALPLRYRYRCFPFALQHGGWVLSSKVQFFHLVATSPPLSLKCGESCSCRSNFPWIAACYSPLRTPFIRNGIHFPQLFFPPPKTNCFAATARTSPFPYDFPALRSAVPFNSSLSSNPLTAHYITPLCRFAKSTTLYKALLLPSPRESAFFLRIQFFPGRVCYFCCRRFQTRPFPLGSVQESRF